MLTHIALLTAATLASSPVSALAGDQDQAGPQISEVPGQGCLVDEDLVFAGDVQDDFGLGVAVCVRDETITIRYSGEGDPQSVSCQISECDGVIHFDHYVRYRFTVITLSWRGTHGEQTITESFNAQNAREAPFHSVSHSWAPPSGASEDAERMVYPVSVYTEPLSLVALARWDWK